MVVKRLKKKISHKNQDLKKTFFSILPELIWLLSWTSTNILPCLNSSGKMSDEVFSTMTRTILSRDSANWSQYGFRCDFAIVLNQCQFISETIFTCGWFNIWQYCNTESQLSDWPCSVPWPLLSLASPRYRDSALASAGTTHIGLSKIGMRLAFLYMGISSNTALLHNQLG